MLAARMRSMRRIVGRNTVDRADYGQQTRFASTGERSRCAHARARSLYHTHTRSSSPHSEEAAESMAPALS